MNTIMMYVVFSQARETALHVCARYDQPEVLSYLCAAGARLNLQDNVSLSGKNTMC